MTKYMYSDTQSTPYAHVYYISSNESKFHAALLYSHRLQVSSHLWPRALSFQF